MTWIDWVLLAGVLALFTIAYVNGSRDVEP